MKDIMISRCNVITYSNIKSSVYLGIQFMISLLTVKQICGHFNSLIRFELW